MIKQVKLNGNTKDLSGQKFNMLKVMFYCGRSRWLCKCDCGNMLTTSTYRLGHNETKSCGCHRDEINSKSRTFDHTGLRYNNLTVLYKFDIYKGKNYTTPRWMCVCDCGNQTIVASTNIKRQQSCGCAKRGKRS